MAGRNQREKNMKTIAMSVLIGGIILAAGAWTPKAAAGPPPTTPPRPPKTEQKWIADLSSKSERTVITALGNLEDILKVEDDAARDASPAIPAIRNLLTDSRKPVVRKAARVLGVIHARVTDADVTSIAVLLSDKDFGTVIDGLKALRGLGAQAKSTVPQIVPLLQHKQVNVKRDACRTLAVIGNKDTIADLQPLLQSSDAAVKKDAADAIAALRDKS